FLTFRRGIEPVEIFRPDLHGQLRRAARLAMMGLVLWRGNGRRLGLAAWEMRGLADRPHLLKVRFGRGLSGFGLELGQVDVVAAFENAHAISYHHTTSAARTGISACFRR